MWILTNSAALANTLSSRLDMVVLLLDNLVINSSESGFRAAVSRSEQAERSGSNFPFPSMTSIWALLLPI